MQGTHPSSIESLFGTAIELCDGELDEADSEFLKLEGKINEALRQASLFSPLASIALAQIAEGRWDSLRQEFDKLKAEVRTFVEAGTPVLSLISVGLAWNREVLPAVSSMSATAGAYEANALPAWSGAAYYAYREKRDAQSEAIEATTKIIQESGVWLTEMAVRNVDFFFALIEPIVDLTKATIEAALEIVTAVGILEAIGTVAAAIADAAMAIMRIYMNSLRHAAKSIDAINRATAMLNDNSKFPAGRWPQAVNKNLAH